MKPAMKKKEDDSFLDDVVDEMPDDGDEKYGADMEEDEGSDEETKQDRLMAAGTLAKALGINTADRQKIADALEAFVKTCM